MAASPKLLVPVDFSEFSERAIRQAARVAGVIGAEIVVLHVLDLPTYAVEEGLGLVAPMDGDRIAPEVEARLLETCARALGEKTPCRVEVREGAACEEILRFVEEAEMDLVVMPTHGRTGLSHLLMGSIAERVVRKAPCPVLVVGRDVATPSDGGAAPAPRKILVPVDFSAGSERAIKTACRYAASDATVIVTHILDRPYSVELGMGAIPPDAAEGQVVEAGQKLEELCGPITPPAAGALQRELRDGLAHEEIIGLARAEGVDLIVLPTHGRTGLAHLLFGSTAERVVRTAECPVLVLRCKPSGG